nr:ral guanine nucleotide dissociation stimulator-like [Equus asinus]
MHDNTVANCILVTCLGDASMTAQDRARVVELWIRVAEECRGLGNFCSLHTILSALQSPAIARLQDTWGQVSRESSRTWKKWVRREKRVSRELLVQEATSVLKTAERARQGAQERQRQQVRVTVGEGGPRSQRRGGSPSQLETSFRRGAFLLR